MGNNISIGIGFSVNEHNVSFESLLIRCVTDLNKRYEGVPVIRDLEPINVGIRTLPQFGALGCNPYCSS